MNEQRAFAAMVPWRSRVAHHQRAKFSVIQPGTNHTAQDTPFAPVPPGFIIVGPVPFSGNHRNEPSTPRLGLDKKPFQRTLRLTLAHTVKIQHCIDLDMPPRNLTGLAGIKPTECGLLDMRCTPAVDGLAKPWRSFFQGPGCLRNIVLPHHHLERHIVPNLPVFHRDHGVSHLAP